MYSTPHVATPNVRDTAALVLETYWDGQLPVKPERIAERMDITLKPRGGVGDSAYQYSGYFSITPSGLPVIEFNRMDSLTRRRFTLAHEIGHFALGHGTSPRDSATNFGTSVHEPKERQANQFAAELLMPEHAVRAMIERGYNSVDKLAELFLVSKAAMGYRLSNLSLDL
jgi:Zn-dependent peptidase ImmA (M78 family)